MAAYEKKKGRLPLRNVVESAIAPPVTLQKSALSNTPKTQAIDYITVCSDQAKVVQPGGGHFVAVHRQAPVVSPGRTAGGQSAAIAVHDSNNSGIGDRSRVADAHAQRELAQIPREAAAAGAKAPPKTCSGSRLRRKDHVKERKTLISPKSAKATEAKTAHQPDAVHLHGAAQKITNDPASPASTTRDGARVFVPQGKGVADTTLDSSPNLQQLSQSSTSATPPASDCSSDDSPSSSPDILEEAAPSCGRSFQPSAAIPTNSVSTVEAGGERTLVDMSPKAGSSTNGKSCTRDGSDKRPTCGDSINSSARSSSAPNWSFVPLEDTQKPKQAATQDTKQEKSEARRGPSPGSDRANINEGDCHIASNSVTAAGQGCAMANNRIALSANCGPAICRGIPARTSDQNPGHSDQAPSTPPHVADTLPSSPPLRPATERSVLAPTARGDVSPLAAGLADTYGSPTSSGLRYQSPDSLRAQLGTLHGPRGTEDEEHQATQQDGGSVQKKGADCGQQPREHFCQVPAGSPNTQDAVVHRTSMVNPKVEIRSPVHQGVAEEGGKTSALVADTQRFSRKQLQQSIISAAPLEHTPSPRVVGNTSSDATCKRVLSEVSLTANQPPSPPPIFTPCPLPSPAPLTPHCAQTSGPSRLTVDADGYSNSPNQFSTSLGYCAETEGHVLSEVNTAYTALGQFPSEHARLPQQQKEREQQHGNAVKLTQQIAGGLESPRGGDRHNNKGGGATIHTCNVISAGGARTWASSSVETNGTHWSLTGVAEVTVKSGNRNSTTNMSLPPSASSNLLAGSARGERREEVGKQGLVPVLYARCNQQSDSFLPETPCTFEGSNAEPDTLLVKPFQGIRPPTSVKMAAASGATVCSPRFGSQDSRRDQDAVYAETGGVQWCRSPPHMPQGCSYHAGQAHPLGEKRVDTVPATEVPLALMREKQNPQPWQKATGSDMDSTTCSRSRCCSSYCCAHSPTTALWSPTVPLSAKRRSIGEGSAVDGGASERHHPNLLTSRTVGTVNKDYASRTQDKPSSLYQMQCHMSSKHLLQQERQPVNGTAVETMRDLGNNWLSYGAVMNDTVVDVPRSVSGSNSGVLWSLSVPPVSLLLTLPLNLPYGKIVKFGSPTVLPQSTVVLPPPPPPSDQVFADSDCHRAVTGLASARPPLMPRTLGAKKSYYCFSPALHPGAHTLFSHAGGICDTFAASLHLELAILYVPPPLLEAVASIFQALAPRVPRLASPLKLECGGLEERNAPGRFGGKVLTVSCAVGDQQERYKFQQMQEFLMLFQSRVELLLREYAVQQQLLLGRKFTSSGQHRQGQGGASAPGKKHNIWRYAMSCLPSSLGCQRLSESSPAVTQGNVALHSGYMAGGAAGVSADAHVTEGETCTGSNNGGNGTGGGGFLDLTIRAFEAKALDKAAKDYAKRLVVKDVCVSEIRLVTTRGIEDKTCEIDPRFPQYSIGTRPIVLGSNGQLCRHSLVDVHELPDVWEVRLRPGNTRDEQKRLVERCVLASIENKPLAVRTETLKAAIDAGVILWVNGKMMLLPPPPPPALEGGLHPETQQKQHQKELHWREARRTGAVYVGGDLQQQQLPPKQGRSHSRNSLLFDSRDSTRGSTKARDTRDQTRGCPAPPVSRQGSTQPFQSSQGDFFSQLLLLSSDSSSVGGLLPCENGESALPTGDNEDRNTANAAAALYGCRGSPSHQRKQLQVPAAVSAFAHSLFPDRPSPGAAIRRGANSSCHTEMESLLTPFTCREIEGDSVENLQTADEAQYQMHALQHRENEANYLESLAAAIAAVPPGLEVPNRTAALTVATQDTQQRLPPVAGEIPPQQGVATPPRLRQTHRLLDVLASGWTPQQQRQQVAGAALEKQQERDIQAEAQEGREQSTDVKKSVCDSVLPAALQYIQQLQQALTSECLESGTPGSPISLETSRVLKRLFSLPAWSSCGESPAQPHEQERLHQQQGGGTGCNTQMTCRRSSGATCDAFISSSAAAVSAARALLTRSRSSAVDPAKTVDSQDISSGPKETAAATFVESVHGGGLSQRREQLEAAVLSNPSGVNASSNFNIGCCSNSGSSSVIPSGVRFTREIEAEEDMGDRYSVCTGGLNASGGASLSISSPFRTAVGPATSVYQGVKSSLPTHSVNLGANMTGAVRAAETACNWGIYLGDSRLEPSAVPGLADSNPFPEALSRQQLLQGPCAAGRGTDIITFNEPQQSAGAVVPEQVRSRVTQQQQGGKRVPPHQQMTPQLPQRPQTLRQRRDSGQQIDTQELLDMHALQLLGSGSDTAGRGIFLQGLLTGDLLQQSNFRSTSCREFVDPALAGEASCNLLQQYGADEAVSQQGANTTSSIRDLHVEGIKQQQTYSQV